jgi:hypothetical protein
MSETVNVILAASASAVALVALGSAVWQQKRGFAHEREMADLADIRRLFDDAAVALHDASRAMSGVERGLFRDGRFVSQRSPEALSNAEEAGERLKVIRGRLRVRLEPADASVQTFARAHDAAWDVIRAVFAMDPGPGGASGEAFKAVQDGHRRLVAATDEFMSAATEAVGARLPVGSR